MTKKHFEAIAGALRETRPAMSPAKIDRTLLVQWLLTAEQITQSISQFNIYFDEHKFREAAGMIDAAETISELVAERGEH